MVDGKRQFTENVSFVLYPAHSCLTQHPLLQQPQINSAPPVPPERNLHPRLPPDTHAGFLSPHLSAGPATDANGAQPGDKRTLDDNTSPAKKFKPDS